MKNIFILILVFVSTLSFSGEFEEQRKYVFDAPSTEFDAFVKSGKINGLSSTYHSQFTYYDIYLDTLDKSLYNNKLSLRLRKRDFGDGTFEYGIQLKSEMVKHGDIRMEVEEDDLSFYNIVYNGEVLKLKAVLDSFYDRFLALSKNATVKVDISNDNELKSLLSKINTWIAFKLGSSVEPFLKLNKMKIAKESLKSLAPVIMGVSKRSRSHINELEGNTWVMETSFDRARFYSLESAKTPFDIREYEVENKSKNAERGRAYMESFEAGIMKEYNAKVNLESKYKQVMNSFLANE